MYLVYMYTRAVYAIRFIYICSVRIHHNGVAYACTIYTLHMLSAICDIPIHILLYVYSIIHYAIQYKSHAHTYTATVYIGSRPEISWIILMPYHRLVPTVAV